MNNTQRCVIIFLLIIIVIEFYYYYTDPYRIFLEPYEDMPEIKFEKIEKKNSILLLHSGKINLDIKKFSENVKEYAKKYNLDYYNSSETSDINLWQTLNTIFKKYNYDYIWVVPTNAYIHNKDKSIHTLINQSGETDLILSRSESDHSAINMDTFIARNSEWTIYKFHQFYYKQQPLQLEDDPIPLTTDIILDQIYTKYMHKTFKDFEEYLDAGIPYMLMNICVYNEHSIMSSRSEFMRYYDRMPSPKKESTQVYPWVMVKHSRFAKIDEIHIDKIVSQKENRKIPKIIFQTMESNLTLINIESCITEIKNLNPDYKYYYFNARQCREFIKREFPDILEYYDILLPGAYKADLWRYCVLYKYGGFYLDIRMYPYMSFDSIITQDTEFMSCIDISQNMLYQAILGVEPKSSYMRNAIDECVKNIRERSLAENDLAVTGPRVMGIALNKTLNRPENDDLDKIKDKRVVLLEWNSKKAPKYLQDDKNIFCCHKYTKLLLDSEVEEETNFWLMLTGKEHYSVLYRNNKIYKDSLFTQNK